MPYIPESRRGEITSELATYSVGWVPQNAGDFNYVISNFMANYLIVKGLKYENINAMVGTLECAKMELNRIIIGPYEDLKIQENGPVYSGILPGTNY